MNTVSIIIDVAVVAFIWIFASLGYKKGLVRTLYGFVSFLVSAILTAVMYKPVSEWILKLDFVKKWTERISSYIVEMIADGVTSQLPEWMWNFAGGGSATWTVGDALASLVVGILCVVVVFIIVKLALTLFVGVLDAVMKLPLLNSVNRLGGVIFGLLKGVVIVWIICAALILFMSTDMFNGINNAIQSTAITKYFYNNNMLMKFIFRQ